MTERQLILGCCLMDSSVLDDLKIEAKFFTTQKDRNLYQLAKRNITNEAEIYQCLKSKYDDIATYLGKIKEGIPINQAKETARRLLNRIEKERIFGMLREQDGSLEKTGSIDEDKIEEFITKWQDLQASKASKLLRFDKIKEEEITWHIPGIYAQGMIHALGGVQGHGKSLHLYDLAARTSTGQLWPITGTHIPKGDVLYITDEDSRGRIIKPRLRLAGADMSKIFIPDFNVDDLMLPQDIPKLEAWIKMLPSPKLLILDPIADYSKGNLNSSDEATRIIKPLKRLADKYNLCLIYTVHFNKKIDLDSIHRVAHSYVLTSKPRLVWLIIKADSENDEDPNRILCNAKTAFKPVPNMLFTITSDEKDNPYIESYTTTTTKTHEALATGEKRRDLKVQEAEELIFETMPQFGGTMYRDDLIKIAEKKGICSISNYNSRPKTLYRAANNIGIVFDSDDKGKAVWKLDRVNPDTAKYSKTYEKGKT